MHISHMAFQKIITKVVGLLLGEFFYVLLPNACCDHDHCMKYTLRPLSLECPLITLDPFEWPKSIDFLPQLHCDLYQGISE